MASVTSLGVHQPVALRHAVEEGILPPDPPPSSYTWEVVVSREGGREFEDELLTTDNCVLWSRGGVFRKSFSFDPEKESVTQALLAYFPASADSPKARPPADRPPKDKKKPAADKPVLSRALVVFLKSQAHIYFLSGASHVVHMPFEVESACAAPCGVVIQRKPRLDGASVSLRLPKVPPSSFVCPQPAPAPWPSHDQNITEFSTEGLGNPKVLPLRLSLTLENMWQPPVETADSRWPRLVCLTDPLQEIGLVVTHPDRPKTARERRGSVGPRFLSPSEEILHIEAVKVPRPSGSDSPELNIAVTVNRETNMYTVWRLSYIENEDPFLGRQKKRKPKPSRRRSSMAPGLASGATTPLHASLRDSLGASAPGKKTKKNVKVEDKEKALDNALSSLDPERGDDASRRQSRRVSSLLARADLSASQDRSTFAEQSIHVAHGGRRAESHSSQRPRISTGYGGLGGFGGAFNPSRSMNHNPDPPVDDLLEELRAGGDFEGFHNMALDDHGFDGLAHEMLLTKIHTVSVDNANVRYSLSNKPARTQAKVFILTGPPTATDDQGHSLLLIAIQDPVDKRLQLLTLYLAQNQDHTPPKGSSKHAPERGGFHIIPAEPRRVQSVVDSCKVSDGNEAIIILSEDKRGGRELSLQSPWGKVTTVTLPPLLLDNVNSLSYSGSYKAGGDPPGLPPAVFHMHGSDIHSICHPRARGVVDLRDKDGRHHRVRIKLQPSSHQVRKVLDVCRSVLHASFADKMVAGWWHVMQWLQDARTAGLQHPLADTEWSAVVILLLASFLALGHNSETSLRTLGGETARPSATNKWEALQLREAPNSSPYPPWMRNKAWQWLLEDGADEGILAPDNFLSVHIDLAKRWMASPGGVSAFGFEGYLPTALNRAGNPRETAACTMFLALHLLAEEQKLDIMCPEDSSPGLCDLRALLCQLARWLGWHRYENLYALSTQIELGAAHELGMGDQCLRLWIEVADCYRHVGPFAVTSLAEPPSDHCVLTWIQESFATGRSTEFPTLSELYTMTTGDAVGGNMRKELWDNLTPRTAMFRRFFSILGSSTQRFEMVVAMHDCGFTPQILETLPEAVLTPFQDIISICQPDPPPSWSKDLLELVHRTDMSTVLRPSRSPRALGSDVHVKTPALRALSLETAC